MHGERAKRWTFPHSLQAYSGICLCLHHTFVRVYDCPCDSFYYASSIFASNKFCFHNGHILNGSLLFQDSWFVGSLGAWFSTRHAFSAMNLES